MFVFILRPFLSIQRSRFYIIQFQLSSHEDPPYRIFNWLHFRHPLHQWHGTAFHSFLFHALRNVRDPELSRCIVASSSPVFRTFNVQMGVVISYQNPPLRASSLRVSEPTPTPLNVLLFLSQFSYYSNTLYSQRLRALM